MAKKQIEKKPDNIKVIFDLLKDLDPLEYKRIIENVEKRLLTDRIKQLGVLNAEKLKYEL